MKVKVRSLFKPTKTFRTPIDQLDSMPTQPSIGRKLFLGSSTFESGGIFTSEVQDWNRIGNVIYVQTCNTVYEITLLVDE